MAAGFVAPSAAPAGTALAADRAIIGDDGIQAPVGYFDPLKLAEKVNDKTLLWFRAAEIKHCRVAMAAFAGCVVTGLGVHWPGAIDMSGTTFESLGQGGLLERLVPGVHLAVEGRLCQRLRQRPLHQHETRPGSCS